MLVRRLNGILSRTNYSIPQHWDMIRRKVLLTKSLQRTNLVAGLLQVVLVLDPSI